MKKILGVTVIAGSFLLTGCSIGLDTGAITSEAEELEARAEVLESEIELVVDTVEELEADKLTADEQERVAGEIAYIQHAMKQFQKMDDTLIGQATKKLTEKKMQETDEVLAAVQAHAAEGQATQEDLKKVKDVLKADFTISLFGD